MRAQVLETGNRNSSSGSACLLCACAHPTHSEWGGVSLAAPSVLGTFMGSGQDSALCAALGTRAIGHTAWCRHMMCVWLLSQNPLQAAHGTNVGGCLLAQAIGNW